MTPLPTTFPTRILVATDGAEDSVLAMHAATDLARRAGAALHVVHVWEPHHVGAHTFHPRSEVSAHHVLDDAVTTVESLGGPTAHTHMRVGHPTDEILTLADELDAGLVVLGTRGLGPVPRLLLGSVAHGVVHHSCCPVLVMRGGLLAWPPRRVLVGDDSSTESARAGDLAVALAGLYASEVVVVHAMPDFAQVAEHTLGAGAHVAEDIMAFARGALDDRVHRMREQTDLDVTPRLEFDEPALALLEVADEEHTPGLIAVGSRGLGPWQRVRFGSVSTKLLQAARCPVLVTPHLPQPEL